MANIQGFRTVSGTYGQVWWDGELLGEIESFKAEVSIEREDVLMAGSFMKDSKANSGKGEGTIKFKKVFSRVQKKFARAYRNGKDPRSKFVAKLEDPDAYGTERVVVENVWFNKIPLANWELGKKCEEELSFGFTDFSFPDLIEVEA